MSGRLGERSNEYHRPVLLAEVLSVLGCGRGDVVVDATIGGGGHARALLGVTAPTGVLIGIDRDPAALAVAEENLKDFSEQVRVDFDSQVRLYHRTHEELGEVLAEEGRRRGEADPLKVNAVLFDLGISSRQVDEAGRGFSFRRSGPLDMRMDPTTGITAADVLNSYSQADLTRVFKEWGEERWASRIAGFVVDWRGREAFQTTDQLVEVVKAAIPAGARRAAGGHPARRVFQALRIEVNREISGLEEALFAAHRSLLTGGRCAVISYHSLEDRVAKRTINKLVADGTAKSLTKKVVRPSKKEASENPRARSARLRVWEAVG